MLRTIFECLRARQNLTVEQAEWVFARIMDGQLSDPTMAAFVGALLVKGESVEELVGAAKVMRGRAIRVACDDPNAIDTCGTGGDGVNTFNVSTCAAIIAAAAGATVAKHGNRSSTRVSGSTEVLNELGMDVEAEGATVERCLREARIGYLNARLLHPAMKYAAPVRQAIPVRTIFNLLGPLTNPAGVQRQLVGVPQPELVDKMAQALHRLGCVHGWVVHGDGGLCDLSVSGPSTVCELREGAFRTFTIVPEEAGLRRGSLDDLRVNSPAESAGRILSILRGEPGACRDHALLNAGAALVVAGLAATLLEGVAKAADAVDSGTAAAKLGAWVRCQVRGAKD